METRRVTRCPATHRKIFHLARADVAASTKRARWQAQWQMTQCENLRASGGMRRSTPTADMRERFIQFVTSGRARAGLPADSAAHVRVHFVPQRAMSNVFSVTRVERVEKGRCGPIACFGDTFVSMRAPHNVHVCTPFSCTRHLPADGARICPISGHQFTDFVDTERALAGAQQQHDIAHDVLATSGEVSLARYVDMFFTPVRRLRARGEKRAAAENDEDPPAKRLEVMRNHGTRCRRSMESRDKISEKIRSSLDVLLDPEACRRAWNRSNEDAQSRAFSIVAGGLASKIQDAASSGARCTIDLSRAFFDMHRIRLEKLGRDKGWTTPFLGISGETRELIARVVTHLFHLFQDDEVFDDMRHMDIHSFVYYVLRFMVPSEDSNIYDRDIPFFPNVLLVKPATAIREMGVPAEPRVVRDKIRSVFNWARHNRDPERRPINFFNEQRRVLAAGASHKDTMNGDP